MSCQGYDETQNPRKDNERCSESGGVPAKPRKTIRCDHRGESGDNKEPHPDEGDRKSETKTEHEQEAFAGLADRERDEHHANRTRARHESPRGAEGDDLPDRGALAPVDVFGKIPEVVVFIVVSRVVMLVSVVATVTVMTMIMMMSPMVVVIDSVRSRVREGSSPSKRSNPSREEPHSEYDNDDATSDRQNVGRLIGKRFTTEEDRTNREPDDDEAMGEGN